MDILKFSSFSLANPPGGLPAGRRDFVEYIYGPLILATDKTFRVIKHLKLRALPLTKKTPVAQYHFLFLLQSLSSCLPEKSGKSWEYCLDRLLKDA